eukprot:7690612-Pyramimonas_sp.AAC.1
MATATMVETDPEAAAMNQTHRVMRSIPLRCRAYPPGRQGTPGHHEPRSGPSEGYLIRPEMATLLGSKLGLSVWPAAGITATPGSAADRGCGWRPIWGHARQKAGQRESRSACDAGDSGEGAQAR